MALANSYSKPSLSAGISPALSKAAVKSRMGSTALQYQRSQVETASPTRLVIMLYEGAMRFCQIALDAMAAGDLPAQHENLLKAQRIVAELLGSLNREKGNEVADNLARLYTHMLQELVAANLHDEPEAVKFVQSMLRDLWASWVEVERITSEGPGARGQGPGEEEKTEDRRQKPETAPLPATNHQSPVVSQPRLGRINA